MTALNDDLTAISEKWLSDVTVTKPSSLPDFVYHYTDAAGLVGMLQTNKVWLTNYKFLNDKSEIVHSRHIAEALLRKFEVADDRSIASRVMKQIKRYAMIPSIEEPFLFSLSEHRDDLSQWRGYAREGLGFTIGFEAAKLAKGMGSGDQFTFAKVSYNDGGQATALEKALKEMLALLEKDIPINGDELTSNIEDAAIRFDWLLDSRGVLNKHKTFQSEAEWRIFSYFEKTSKEIKVRASSFRLIPYIEAILDDGNDKLPLASIGIGPGFVGPEVKDAVQSLLNQYDHKANIYFAETPYRRL